MGLSGYQTIRWLQKHRTLARIFNRGPIRPWISRRVWAEIQADPEAVAGLQRGMEDMRLHRTWRINRETREVMAHPDWPLDGPQPDSPRGVWVPDPLLFGEEDQP